MFATRLTTLLVTVGLAAAAAQAQFPTPSIAPPAGLPIRQTFSSNSEGWMPIGDGAKAEPMENPLTVNSAKGALELDYQVGGSSAAAFLLQMGDGALAGAKTFHFMIRSDHPTTMIFGLQEKEAGRYIAMFTLPKDKWQEVNLTPADFTLADGPDDPKDPDNKLDLDEVQYVGLIDAASFAALSPDTNMKDLFGVQTGAHTLYLADFQITGIGAQGLRSADIVDSFEHPQLDWLLLGGKQGAVIDGSPLAGRGLAFTYKQAPAKVSGLLRNVPKGEFTGATKLQFSVASTNATTLVVQVEKPDGGKYNTMVQVPAGATHATDMTLSFADFKAAHDSKDADGKLDLDQVSKLLILDATGMLGGVTAETSNTLYVGGIRLIR